MCDAIFSMQPAQPPWICFSSCSYHLNMESDVLFHALALLYVQTWPEYVSPASAAVFMQIDIWITFPPSLSPSPPALHLFLGLQPADSIQQCRNQVTIRSASVRVG